jgi:hypothetical protein
VRDVNLVAEHKERHSGERVVGQQAVQLLLGFREALLVHGIHQEDDGVHLQAAEMRVSIRALMPRAV